MPFSRYFRLWTGVNFLWICVLFLWQTVGSVIKFSITKVVSWVKIVKRIKQSGFIPVALRNISLFLHKFLKENFCNISSLFLQATFSEGIHFLFGVAWFPLSIFQFQTLLRHETSEISDPTNEVSQFFGVGLVAFCFTVALWILKELSQV